MRKKTILTIAIAVLAVAAIAVTAAAFKSGSTVSDSATALTVNGEPVAAGEFRMRMTYTYSAQTYSYFQQKYGAKPGGDFWTTKYGGQTPIGYARGLTLQDEVRTKVQQILMKQNGVAGDISYEGFLQSLRQENEKRREAVKKGQIIYGPEQFGENEYFDYQLGNLVYKLKEKLFSGQNAISEADLRKQYEADKDKKYKLPDSITLDKISIKFDDAAGEANAKRQIAKAREMLDAGAAFEDVARTFNKGGKPEEQTMDETTAKTDEYMYPQLKAVADGMSAGQISGPLKLADEYAIVRCKAKTSGRYRSLVTVQDQVSSDAIDARYEAMIDKLAGEASVQLNKEVYDRIIP